MQPSDSTVARSQFIGPRAKSQPAEPLEVARLRKEKSDLEDRIATLRETIDMMHKTVERLTSECEAQHLREMSADDEIASQAQQIRELKDLVATLTDRITDCKRDTKMAQIAAEEAKMVKRRRDGEEAKRRRGKDGKDGEDGEDGGGRDTDGGGKGSRTEFIPRHADCPVCGTLFECGVQVKLEAVAGGKGAWGARKYDPKGDPWL